MAHLSLAEGKSIAVKGFVLLLIVTLVEVFIALIGNGHLIEGFYLSKLIMIPVMVVLSLYKAYFIVKEFMHLGHETKGMAASIVLPTLLLLWAIIAFLWEGEAWRKNRAYVKQPNVKETSPDKPTGALFKAELEAGLRFS